jgi:hypothetical protein
MVVDERENTEVEPLVGRSRPEARERSNERWSAGPEGLLLHRRTSSLGASVFEPPLVMLPAGAEPGRTWQVGRARDGSLTIDLEGQVVGVEDVGTEAGTHRGCLRVRHRGPVSTAGEGGGEGDHPIGRFERDLWLCRGVGMVKELVRFELEQEVVDSAGGEYPLRTSDVVASVLVRYAPASP